MTFQQVLHRIVDALDEVGIPYMLTGSFASSYHGSPRATQDIDLVVAPTSHQLRRLVALLPATEYYVNEQSALDACARESQFNIVDLETGWKIDLIIRRSRPFSHTEFERRVPIALDGIRLYVATAEDLLVAKLEWAKLGESTRQIEDAAGILRIRQTELDMPYIARWVEALGLQLEWDAAQRASVATRSD